MAGLTPTKPDCHPVEAATTALGAHRLIVDLTRPWIMVHNSVTVMLIGVVNRHTGRRRQMIHVEYLVLGTGTTRVNNTDALVRHGISTVHAQRFPVLVSLAAAYRILIPWADINTHFLFRLDVLDERGTSVFPANQPHEASQIWTTDTDVLFPHEDQYFVDTETLEDLWCSTIGWYYVVAYINEHEAKRTAFRAAPLLPSHGATTGLRQQ